MRDIVPTDFLNQEYALMRSIQAQNPFSGISKKTDGPRTLQNKKPGLGILLGKQIGIVLHTKVHTIRPVQTALNVLQCRLKMECTLMYILRKDRFF